MCHPCLSLRAILNHVKHTCGLRKRNSHKINLERVLYRKSDRKRSKSNVFWLSALIVTSSLLTINHSVASDSHSNSLERLRAKAAHPPRNLDPSDYALTLDDNCDYMISSSDREIRRVTYFDLGGNKHVAKRDHYGNRFGTEVSLADTALAGVVEPGGSLFIKVRANSWRRHGRPAVVEFLDIPACDPAVTCPAATLNDPVFLDYSANPGSFNVSVMSNAGSRSCTVADSTVTNGLFLFDDLDAARNENSVEVIVNGARDSLTLLTDEEFEACAVAFNCNFQQ